MTTRRRLNDALRRLVNAFFVPPTWIEENVGTGAVAIWLVGILFVAPVAITVCIMR